MDTVLAAAASNSRDAVATRRDHGTGGAGCRILLRRALFDAGHRFAALTAAARRLAIPPLPEPEIPAPWSAALDAVSLPGGSSPTAISTYPGGAASESTTDLADPVEEKAPTLADSDWFTYITAVVIGAGVAALLWQHIATGLAVGVLMIILLVATDQILGKDIPRDTS